MATIKKLPYKGGATVEKIGTYKGERTVTSLPYKTYKTTNGNKPAKIATGETSEAAKRGVRNKKTATANVKKKAIKAGKAMASEGREELAVKKRVAGRLVRKGASGTYNGKANSKQKRY